MSVIRATVRPLCSLAATAVVLALPLPAQEAAEEPVERTVVEAPLTPNPDETAEPADEQPVQLGTQVQPNELVHVPVTGIFPGGVRPQLSLEIPDLEDEARIWRGKTYFNQFNCIGCHGPYGGGGMGPSLSNTTFKYGRSPRTST